MKETLASLTEDEASLVFDAEPSEIAAVGDAVDFNERAYEGLLARIGLSPDDTANEKRVIARINERIREIVLAKHSGLTVNSSLRQAVQFRMPSSKSRAYSLREVEEALIAALGSYQPGLDMN